MTRTPPVAAARRAARRASPHETRWRDDRVYLRVPKPLARRSSVGADGSCDLCECVAPCRSRPWLGIAAAAAGGDHEAAIDQLRDDLCATFSSLSGDLCDAEALLP